MEYCLTYDRSAGVLWADLIRRFKAAGQRAAAWLSAVSREQPQGEMSRAMLNQRAEHILNTYGNSLLRYAYSYLHNMSDAEEVLQDTLVRFLQTAPAFESAPHEKAWLMRVAGNLSKNRLDYNKVRMADELSEELAADGQEELSFVWDAVKGLPDRLRAVIHLYYYEGYSTAEIARLLKRNEATVRSDLRRGRARLKEVLKEAYDFE